MRGCSSLLSPQSSSSSQTQSSLIQRRLLHENSPLLQTFGARKGDKALNMTWEVKFSLIRMNSIILKLFCIQRRGQTKISGEAKPKNFQTGGAKRYTQTFLLHFSITILVNFLKVGGQLPPHTSPWPRHWNHGHRKNVDDVMCIAIMGKCYVSSKHKFTLT